MEASTDAEPEIQPGPSTPAATAAEELEEQQEEDENELAMAKAQSLIDKVTASPENPSPKALHALSTILETQESRYLEDADHSSTNNTRSSHSIGRLGYLIQCKLMSMEQEAELPTSENSQRLNQWIEIQDSLKKRLITENGFNWRLITPVKDQDSHGGETLKYVGGVDLSFSKNHPSIACASLLVLDFPTLDVVYEDFAIVELTIPYVPGFLAFREARVLLELLEQLKKRAISSFPQVLMVDGNGLLHPRGFGLACHLGVLADLPTIGIGKNLHHVDGLSQTRVKQLLQANGDSSSDIITLIGDSGSTLGAAMRSSKGSVKPIFISVGHRISLASAIEIVKLSCKFRIPEPIRQADIRSKSHLRKHGLS